MSRMRGGGGGGWEGLKLNAGGKCKLDFRYYGAGKKRGDSGGGGAQIIAAIEMAPQSGQYDVIMSDFSRARLGRAELP